MQYLGGKEKVAKKIVEFLESKRKPGQLFIDGTVGGASIITRMSGDRLGIDVHSSLICLYNAILTGFEPPSAVSELDYENAKSLPDNNPLKAFIGFGCSFSGKYFSGYARGSIDRNYAQNAKNSLEKKFKNKIGLSFKNMSLFDLDVEGALIYLDPPYANTTKYSVDFNYNKFWDKVRDLSKNNLVYISEYSAPEDFKCVYEFNRNLEMHCNHAEKIRIEKIFTKSEFQC